MADNENIKPERWDQDETPPPCTVAYHFSLLDISKNLRFCCHGSRVSSKYEGLDRQWDETTYQEFRKNWYENYHLQKGLCLGCPHHKENKTWGRVIDEYLAEHGSKTEITNQKNSLHPINWFNKLKSLAFNFKRMKS